MSEEEPLRWAVVVLSWNRREDTLRCLASVRSVRREGVQVICVDNASNDGTAEAVAERFPEAVLIEAGANLGYAGGNNRGIRRALHDGADWVILLNNDATVDPGVIEGFEDALADSPGAGILAGKVLYADRPFTIWFAGQRVSTLLGYSGRPRGYGRPDGRRYMRVTDTGRAVGALMAVSRELIERVGMLEEDLFAYVEDVDWALRARSAGFGVRFAPGARAWHSVSASSGGEASATTPLYYGVRNTIAVLDRRRPLPAPARWLRRRLILATFSLHALRHADRTAAMAAVAEGYADALAGRLGMRSVSR